VGFVVDKMALRQVFSEYFGFPCQSSFHQLLHNHPHPDVAAVPGDVSPTPLKKKYMKTKETVNVANTDTELNEQNFEKVDTFECQGSKITS
jgi:hypothetical protein